MPRQPDDRWWLDLALAAPGGRVLELGAGTGRLSAALVDAGLQLTAADHDPEMLARLVELADTLGPDRLEVLDAEVTALPDGPAAGLVALPASLLNELPDAAARRAALAGAARRCRVDGHVAVHLLSPWWLVGLDGRSTGQLVAEDGSAPVEVVIEAGAFSPWEARRRATLSYRFDDGLVLVDHLDAAVIAPAEIGAAMAAAGLELVAIHGSLPPAPIAAGDVAWHLLARPSSTPTG